MGYNELERRKNKVNNFISNRTLCLNKLVEKL